MLLILILSILVSQINAECCPSRRYGMGPPKCGDGTHLEGRYCGYGKCNIFGCNCDNGCRHPRTMQPFEAGDVIACYEYTVGIGLGSMTTDIPIYHVMLALNNTDIIQANSNGTINHEPFIAKLAEHSKYDHCQIVTRYLDNIMINDLGITPSTIEMILFRALSDNNRIISYDKTYNNSEHWVTHWKYNSYLNTQHVTSETNWRYDVRSMFSNEPRIQRYYHWWS